MIKKITGGLFEELTYIYSDDTTGHGFIIDPGASLDDILSYLQVNKITLEKILITHGHLDHIKTAKQLREVLNIPIIIHHEGKIYLEKPEWNVSEGFFNEPISFVADSYVEQGDIITLEANKAFSLEVIYTPGHTKDGVIYYSKKDKLAFVGDTIFSGSVGRSDLPGGNTLQLLESIKNKVFTLEEEVVLYPGHGPWTTVGREKLTNPAFNLYDE